MPLQLSLVTHGARQRGAARGSRERHAGEGERELIAELAFHDQAIRPISHALTVPPPTGEREKSRPWSPG